MKGTDRKGTAWRRRLSALALALALSLSLVVPASAAEDESLAETARKAAAAALAYGSGASVSWAVWQEGEIIETGSLDASGSELPADGVYGIGSVSKMYTTAAVMKLAEAGKLSLDKPVTAYLPDFKMEDGRYKQITVRMLLNHSSGLMGSSISSGMLFDDSDRTATKQLLDRLAGQRLKADPGAFSVYCNDGFTLAELVVEAVSGKDFMDYVRTELLEPAGLERTYAPGDPFEGRASIYWAGDERPLPIDCLGILGTGGLYASASDLAAFGGALTGEGLLKQSSLDAMAAAEYAKGIWPEDTLDALAYGLGWDNVKWFPFSQSGIQAMVKGGDTQYYHAGLVVIPEYNLAAAVLTSGGVSTYNEMAASQMLVKALADEGVTVDETAPALSEAEPAAMPQELLDFAGYYGSSVSYRVDISDSGTLTMTYLDYPDIPEITFTYYSDGSFRDEDNASCLRLVKEANGQVYLYQKAFSQFPDLGGLGTSNYVAMKLPENEISSGLQAQWDKFLSGTSILPMNERYSSQVYLAIAGMTEAEAGEDTDGIPGYVGTMRIVDENRAEYAVQIPGNAGRDGSDIELRRDEDGAVWLYQSTGAVYMEEAAAPVLSVSKGKVKATVGKEGYALWYHVDENAAGKTLTIQMPENAGFWAYDGERNLIASSVLWGGSSVELPEDGLIALAGDPGAVFSLSYS